MYSKFLHLLFITSLSGAFCGISTSASLFIGQSGTEQTGDVLASVDASLDVPNSEDEQIDSSVNEHHLTKKIEDAVEQESLDLIKSLTQFASQSVIDKLLLSSAHNNFIQGIEYSLTKNPSVVGKGIALMRAVIKDHSDVVEKLVNKVEPRQVSTALKKAVGYFNPKDYRPTIAQMLFRKASSQVINDLLSSARKRNRSEALSVLNGLLYDCWVEKLSDAAVKGDLKTVELLINSQKRLDRRLVLLGIGHIFRLAVEDGRLDIVMSLYTRVHEEDMIDSIVAACESLVNRQLLELLVSRVSDAGCKRLMERWLPLASQDFEVKMRSWLIQALILRVSEQSVTKAYNRAMRRGDHGLALEIVKQKSSL